MNRRYIRAANILIAAIGLACITQISNASTLATSSINSGGRRLSASSIQIDSSIGLTGELCSNQAETLTTKNGYPGQLIDLTSLDVTAASASVDETATCQFTAMGIFDDLTKGKLFGTPNWTILSGPLTNINTSGLATAGNVFENTPATVRSACGIAIGQKQILVVNTNSDDFGIYAMDGLPDDWQAQHFGIDNTNAAAALDPDGDGYDNISEYVAGTAPTNDASYFAMNVSPVAGMPSRIDVSYLPAYISRDYSVERTESLVTPQWDTLVDSSTATNGLEQTVTDLAATNSAGFYRVRIDYTP